MDVEGGCEAPRERGLCVRNKDVKGNDDNCELGERCGKSWLQKETRT